MPKYLTCPLCEAMCGLTVEVQAERVVHIAGDEHDPLSHGFVCPKALALKDIHEDPHRLRGPIRKDGAGWKPISWDQAFDIAGHRLAAIQTRHGRDSLAFYTGNPNVHSYAAQLFELEFAKCLATRNLYSTASMDHLPHLMASYHMFGSQFLLPVPDLDRTAYLLILGANPAESNGSLMSAPGMPARLKAIRQRGGEVVVVDPQRTRTADFAGKHIFIRPGTDALFLLALIQVLFAENLAGPGRLGEFTRGIGALARAAAPFTPETVSAPAGIAAETIRATAREFAHASSAVCYARIGACTQEFGALTCWLAVAMNVLTGNLDHAGGSMFSKPAVDIVKIASLLGENGSFAKGRSRVRQLPEFGGFLPVAALSEEMEAPGEGQVRALITSAGNPVLSTPNGARLERALAKLEFMVSIDLYVNETTRFADLILPPAGPLERDHYDIGLRALAVRNTTRYTNPVFAPDSTMRQDWQIYAELGSRVASQRGGFAGYLAHLRMAAMARITPRRMLDLWLRLGPYRLTRAALENEDHARDLGPLESCLPERLQTKGKHIHLAPRIYLDDLTRLQLRHPASQTGARELLLIGRRQLRSNNSWMHRYGRLAAATNRCTARIHPEDAAARGIRNGDPVEIRSRVGTIVLPAELSGRIMPGVVSVPHGFGHHRAGYPNGPQLIAAGDPGASANDITDEGHIDALSGVICFNGVPVTLLRAPAAAK